MFWFLTTQALAHPATYFTTHPSSFLNIGNVFSTTRCRKISLWRNSMNEKRPIPKSLKKATDEIADIIEKEGSKKANQGAKKC